MQVATLALRRVQRSPRVRITLTRQERVPQSLSCRRSLRRVQAEQPGTQIHRLIHLFDMLSGIVCRRMRQWRGVYVWVQRENELLDAVWVRVDRRDIADDRPIWLNQRQAYFRTPLHTHYAAWHIALCSLDHTLPQSPSAPRHRHWS